MLKTLSELTGDLEPRANRPKNLRNSGGSSALADIVALQRLVSHYEQLIFHVTDSLDQSLLQARLLFISYIMREPRKNLDMLYVVHACNSFPKGLILQDGDKLICVVSFGCVGFNILGPRPSYTITVIDYVRVSPCVIVATHISL